MKIIQNFCVVFNDAENGLGVACFLNCIFLVNCCTCPTVDMMLLMDDQQREPMHYATSHVNRHF